jgi:hypothetical protein
MGNHEWAFYGWREGAAHQFFGPNNATDVWFIKKVSSHHAVHLTQKPVELARRAIEYSSRRGENVLDLFGGSGSTLIAAEQTGRRAFLMELDALYCDVMVRRWEQFTSRPFSTTGRWRTPRPTIRSAAVAQVSSAPTVNGDRVISSATGTPSKRWPRAAARRRSRSVSMPTIWPRSQTTTPVLRPLINAAACVTDASGEVNMGSGVIISRTETRTAPAELDTSAAIFEDIRSTHRTTDPMPNDR